MSASAVWLASLLALPIAGAPLLAHRAFRGYGIPARIALAAAAGAVLLSGTMTIGSIFHWPWRLPVLLLVTLGESFALRSLLRRAPRAAPRIAGGPFSAPEWAALCIGALALLAAAAAALAGCATSPDLLLFWGPKGQAFALARGIDDMYLGDPVLIYQHASYPPLVPNVYAFATIAAGPLRFPWIAAVATFPLLLAATAAALPGVLRRSVPRRDALVAMAAITACLGFLGDALDMAGNADAALLLFETLAIAILLGPAGEERPGQLLAGLLLAGAVAAKAEGLPFAFAAGAIFLLARRRRIRWPSAPLLLFAPAALSLGAWFAFGRLRHLFHGYETYGPTFEIHWDRLGLVIRAIGRSLAQAGAGVPWLLPLAALLAGLGKPRRAAGDSDAMTALYPAAIAAILAGFFVFTYLHGPDPTLWIVWSAGRIFAVVAVLLVLAVTAGQARNAAAGTA